MSLLSYPLRADKWDPVTEDLAACSNAAAVCMSMISDAAMKIVEGVAGKGITDISASPGGDTGTLGEIENW